MKDGTKKSKKAKDKLAAPALDRVYDPMRLQPGYDKDPACMHFYYIGPDVGGEREYRHYFYADRDRPIPYDEAEFVARTLVLNATSRMEQLPPPEVADLELVQDPHGREKLVWYRKSYLVFFVNDPNLHLEPKNAISFEPLPGGSYSPNHSFFDAWDMELNLGGRTPQTAVGLINHMKKNVKGEELGRMKQRFYFKLNFVEFPITFPDSGGTNMGPPIPPP